MTTPQPQEDTGHHFSHDKLSNRILLAVGAAILFQPGAGAAPGAVTPHAIASAPSFADVLINLVPRNPVDAMAKDEMLPAIVFSILLGLALTFAGSPGKRMTALFDDLNAAVMKLVDIIMTLAPYGVFALIASLAATTGWHAFAGLVKYVVLVLAVLLLQAGVVYPTFLRTLEDGLGTANRVSSFTIPLGATINSARLAKLACPSGGSGRAGRSRAAG